MWWLLGGVFLYLFAKGNITKKLKELVKWYKMNKDKVIEWEGNPGILSAFKKLEKAIKDAKLDHKWDAVEIFTVISLAYNLFSLIKQHEEK